MRVFPFESLEPAPAEPEGTTHKLDRRQVSPRGRCATWSTTVKGGPLRTLLDHLVLRIASDSGTDLTRWRMMCGLREGTADHSTSATRLRYRLDPTLPRRGALICPSCRR